MTSRMNSVPGTVLPGLLPYTIEYVTRDHAMEASQRQLTLLKIAICTGRFGDEAAKRARQVRLDFPSTVFDEELMKTMGET